MSISVSVVINHHCSVREGNAGIVCALQITPPPPLHPPRTNNYIDYSLTKNCIVDIYLHFAKLCPILQFLGYAYGDICARYNQSSNLVSIWNPSIDFVKKKTWSNMHFLPLFMYGRLCWCANIPTLYCRMNTLLAFW